MKKKKIKKIKISKKDAKLVKDYEEGRYLRVDEEVDNKKLLMLREESNGE